MKNVFIILYRQHIEPLQMPGHYIDILASNTASNIVDIIPFTYSGEVMELLDKIISLHDSYLFSTWSVTGNYKRLNRFMHY